MTLSNKPRFVILKPEQVFRSEITTTVLIPFAALRHFAALRETVLKQRCKVASGVSRTLIGFVPISKSY